ncbi:MAG: DUF1244 domain-containing protein [Pseudomonadota bacterium]|nr:DUF1244 domain-containing protein [Pseudomonadota bacterium]
MDEDKKILIEAAAFRRLIKHFQKRTDVQNIDVMNVAGFCRNCLSRWYREEAIALNEEISVEQAREIVYNMSYKDWKEKFQK